MASVRRPRAASLTLGHMSSSLDQRLGDLEAGEGDALNGPLQTYVPPVGHGLANSWTPNSVLALSDTIDPRVQYTL